MQCISEFISPIYTTFAKLVLNKKVKYYNYKRTYKVYKFVKCAKVQLKILYY